jgi:quinol-cytochrome oxidoreductase complex cytochrome b subunit
MAMFQTLKILPAHILGIEGELLGVLGFGAVGAVLILIPFLDRRTAAGQPSRFPVVFGIALILYSIVLTFLGYTMSPTK